LGASIFSSAGWNVGWNGSLWVAVGSGTNTIATSPDGITWTGRGSSIFSGIGYDVAWNGTYWVAVGTGTNSFAYSTDGINWTGAGTSPLTTGDGVAWNGSLWVAVGSGASDGIATSTDGITWTGRGNSVLSTGFGIAWNGSLWVAMGQGASHTIATSPDGITWTGRGNSIFTTWGRGIAWNGSYWIGAGLGTNTLAYSVDAITWTGLGTSVLSSTGRGVAARRVLPYVGTSPLAPRILNPATNRVLTASGSSATTAQAQSNLTFDGTTLTVTGSTNVSASNTTNTTITQNLYAPSTADVSAIAYINVGLGQNGGTGGPSSNLQFLWLRSGGAPFRYAGINYGAYNTSSFLTYNTNNSLVTKHVSTILPTSQSQLDVCASLFTLTSSGLVGLNTAPSYTLDVSCGNTASTMRIQANAYPSIELRGYSDTSLGQILYDATTANARFMLRSSSGVPITFESPGNAERMRLTSAGNLGLATTRPRTGYLSNSNATTAIPAVDVSGQLYARLPVFNISGTSIDISTVANYNTYANSYFYITNPSFSAISNPNVTSSNQGGTFFQFKNATSVYLSVTMAGTTSISSPVVIPPSNAITLVVSPISNNTFLLF
jgi:hypothetical protein